MTGITSTESGSSHILFYEEEKRMCITMKQNSLIIDGNAVYELDMECLRKKRQMDVRTEKNEKRREGVSNRVSIRTVNER